MTNILPSSFRIIYVFPFCEAAGKECKWGTRKECPQDPGAACPYVIEEKSCEKEVCREGKIAERA